MSSTPLTNYAVSLTPSERRLLLALPLAVVACVLVGVYAPAALGIACAVLAGAAFLDRPFPLLLLMVFLIPFNFVFTIGPIPVAVELLKVFAWVPFLITREARGNFKTSKYNKWFAMLAGIILLSLLRAHDFPYTLKESVRLGSNICLVYLVLNLVDDREKVLQVFRVLAFSTFLVACYGFYQWAIQDYGALFWIVNPRLNTSLAHYREDFWPWRNRIISVLTSEMELGHYFNLCLPIGAFLWLTEGRRRIGSKWFLMTISMLAGLVLTFTFGAWLALAATCGLFAFLFGGAKRWRVVTAAVVILLLLAAFVAFGPLRPVVEAKATGNEIGSFAWDAATRLYSWKLALQTWWSHPLLGVGIGNFEYIYATSYDFVLGAKSQGTSPHETYLYLLANVGLVGTISVLVVMLSAIRSNLKIRYSQSTMALAGLALAFALGTNLMGWFSDDSGFFGPHASYLVWLLVGLTEAISRISAQEGELRLLTENA